MMKAFLLTNVYRKFIKLRTNMSNSNREENEQQDEGDILPADLVKQLQNRVSIFDRRKDEENFQNMLAQFLYK